jgi:hypothetical protein
MNSELTHWNIRSWPCQFCLAILPGFRQFTQPYPSAILCDGFEHTS